MAQTEGDGRRSLLERALGIVTEVHEGEGPTALLLTLNVFLLLTAYYLIKPVREGLILTMKSGAEYKSYLSAVISLSLLLVVPAYAWVANRVSKNRLVVGVTLFFGSHLAVFWVLSKIPPVERNLGLVFFVWVSIFNMMVVAQFWAFANDLYSVERGKRLFPLVGMGASIGGAVGAYITSFLQDIVHLGVYELLLVSGALLGVSAFLTQLAHRRERGAQKKNETSDDGAEKEKKKDGAFRLVLTNRYLLYIALFSLVFTWVNTNGEYMLGVLVREQSAEAAKAAGVVSDEAIRGFSKGFVTHFYANFFLWVNIFGILIQTFAVSRIVKVGGLRIAFFVFPLLAFLDSLSIIILPALLGLKTLQVFRPGKIAENATDYSLNNTVRNMLWLPTTTDMKYKAKQAVDTFFVRMGDVASAGVVFFGADLLKWGVRGFAVTNAVLVGVWLFLARGIVTRNRELTEKAEGTSGDDDKAAT